MKDLHHSNNLLIKFFLYPTIFLVPRCISIPKTKQLPSGIQVLEGIMVGYEERTKGFCCWVPSLRHLMISRNVKFDETSMLLRLVQYSNMKSSQLTPNPSQVALPTLQDSTPESHSSGTLDQGLTLPSMTPRDSTKRPTQLDSFPMLDNGNSTS